MGGRLSSILKSKSPRYLAFRTSYELARKTGMLALKFPTHPKQSGFLSLKDWKEAGGKYLFNGNRNLMVPKVPSGKLKEDTQRILNGEICYFSSKWHQVGLDYDWVTNPLTGYCYDVRQHWTKVNDFSQEAGDIKFVWEASRFGFLYTLVRNDYHNGEDHASFAIARILDWIDKNPLNCGPNYKCSQEISIRVMNWLFALHFYQDSPALTEEKWGRIIASIYWQIRHVYGNIHFSRIAVRNNHAVTETLMLYLAGLLFPSFPDAAKWRKQGKAWFEQEIVYQFEPDGSYIQNSMNYQRVVVQLLTLGISLAHLNGDAFSKVVYDRAYACVNFLFQCQDEKTGMLPNYGANDGALFFQLDENDYCDYCPQLDALYFALTGGALYGKHFEDACWYNVDAGIAYPPIIKQEGIVTFPQGGYYLIRDLDGFLFLRCGSFKDICTPDLLHVDYWKDGENLLLDGGSYLYNADMETVRYFSGTESHNTIMVGDRDQMLKGPRFIWTHPSDVVSVETRESDSEYVLDCRIRSFKYLDGGYGIHRVVRKRKGVPELFVDDEIAPCTAMPFRQLWHTKSEAVQMDSDGERELKTGWYSRYYGTKEACRSIGFATNGNRIATKIIIAQE